MNIIHMIDSEGMFGAEYVIYYLLPELRNLGANVHFACMCPRDSPGADLGRRLEQKGIPVFYLDERKKFSIKSFYSIYRALRTSQADVLHVHGYKATILGGFISQLMRLPMVTTYHAEAETYHGLKIKTYAAIETSFLKRASKIIAVSRMIKKGLISRGIPTERISVIVNGVDDLTRGFFVKARNISPHVLCIGRLIQLKRFDLVIKAVSILKEEFPGLHLTIAGSGPLEGKLRSLADDLRIADRVSLPGYVSDPRDMLSQADVFVLPSETEGSPISLIEAMIFSIPVIASKVGSIPDMLQSLNGPTLIKPGDQEQLINSLRFILSRPQLRRDLGKFARRLFEREFTSEIMASRYMSQYENVLLNNATPLHLKERRTERC